MIRGIGWFAVVAALTLGANDGLASFYWAGWRVDISLNLFLLLLVGSCFALVTTIQAVEALTTLPKRAREWRLAQRERSAQIALREAWAEYFGARYSRAQKAAQRALAIQSQTPDLAQDGAFMALAALTGAWVIKRALMRRKYDPELASPIAFAARYSAPRRATRASTMP